MDERKTANDVAPLLDHFIRINITPKHVRGVIWRLIINADNYAARNKTRFVLMYLC